MKWLPKHINQLLLATSCFLITITTSAQDIHFSQFFEAPLLRNPSLAGIFTGDIRVQAVYRTQWNSVTNAYQTGSFNSEFKLPIGKASDFITTGIQILYDRAGTVSWVTTHVLPTINFHKSLSVDRNQYLSLGFMGGPVQQRFDRSKMTTNNSYDGGGDGETFIDPQYTYIDGAVGLSYNTQLNDNPDNNVFFGLAYHHFTRPKNSFYRNGTAVLDPKWVGSAGVRFVATTTSYVTIQGDYSQQGKFTETIAGALYAMKLGPDPEKPSYILQGGAFLRWNDAIIPVIQLDYNPFSITLSYDVNISKLKSSSYGRGGFEMGITYIGFTHSKKSSLNYMNCPRF